MIDSEGVKGICVKGETLIFDCVVIINNENSQMLLVVDDDGGLIGVVSDGDLRRKFVVGKVDPMQPIKLIMSNDPIFIFENDDSEEKALDIMKNNNISFVPVLDKNRIPIGVYTWKDVIGIHDPNIKSVDVPVVIMAGGKGVRLRPYTDVLPKPLIPVGGKTMIEKVMDSFIRYGIKRFYISINYKKELIKAYFNTTSLDCVLKYIEEEDYLGTCGALSMLTDIKETFILSNCDTLFEIDLEDLLYRHHMEHNVITAVVCEKSIMLPYGIFEFDDSGNVCGFSEKPKTSHVINTGLYVIEPDVIDKIKKHTPLGMDDLIIQCLQSNDKVGVYSVKEDSWKDLGQMGAIYMMMGNK